MNGRLLAKRLAGSVFLLLGIAGFFTEVEFGTKIIGFVMCAAIAWLFFRKTYWDKQEELIERCRNGELPEHLAAKLALDAREEAPGQESRMSERESRAPDLGRTAKRVAVGATVLHVAAGPFIILAKLLRMQK